jgi:hypothetical protein
VPLQSKAVAACLPFSKTNSLIWVCPCRFAAIMAPAVMKLQRLQRLPSIQNPQTPHELWFTKHFRGRLLAIMATLQNPEAETVAKPEKAGNELKNLVRAVSSCVRQAFKYPSPPPRPARNTRYVTLPVPESTLSRAIGVAGYLLCPPPDDRRTLLCKKSRWSDVLVKDRGLLGNALTSSARNKEFADIRAMFGNPGPQCPACMYDSPSKSDPASDS